MQYNTANVLVEVENITAHMTFRPFVRVGIKISSKTMRRYGYLFLYLFFNYHPYTATVLNVIRRIVN